jgi:TM2 domain-containing membrane protein YozV
MKKALILSFICFCSLYTFAAGNNPYTVDDQKVEQLFTNSVDASLSLLSDNTNKLTPTGQLDFGASAKFRSSDRSFVAAILLDFFLGGFGIHRLYLGTATMTWIGYILTCGGIFGLVPFVDFIVLIVHSDDMSPYEDNSAFFMWATS